MEEILNKILVKLVNLEEKVNVMEEHMVTKDYLDERINSVLISTDRFVKLHETLDQELAMLRSK